jgi:sugar O-acyltransferase (sialic acid O-acetyltransferase NeuD family)
MKELALFGYGGHAREVAAQISQDVVFFVDDIYASENIRPFSSFKPEEFSLMIAVADPKQRQQISQRVPFGTEYFSFVHNSVLMLSPDIEIGEGSFIGANSILTTNIKIGKHAILNRGNQIGHDTRIGDFFSAMPGSIISGNSDIKDRVYLGTNSTIIEGKKVVSDVTVGANGVVIRNISEPGTYVGVPVKKIRKNL